MGAISLSEKKHAVRSLNPYIQNGYQIMGKHLAKQNRDGSWNYILMYERNLLKK